MIRHSLSRDQELLINLPLALQHLTSGKSIIGRYDNRVRLIIICFAHTGREIWMVKAKGFEFALPEGLEGSSGPWARAVQISEEGKSPECEQQSALSTRYLLRQVPQE
jgi:hypothetical protein